MNLNENIIKAINNICIKSKEVKKISLFGSRARGDNNERSDIDLAVYFLTNPYYDVIEELENIETLLKVDITIVNDSIDDKFITNIRNEEIIIYMSKFDNKYDNFKKAVAKLSIIVEQMDIDDDIVRDSLIQRFEFCYELAWKTLKEYLQYNGLTLESMPRPVFKVAYENNIINHENIWLEMIKDRNIASHEYSEERIKLVAINIRDNYYKEFVDLLKKLGE